MDHHFQAAIEAAASDIVRQLGGTWRTGGGMCRCPAHDDATPSLSVRIGNRSLLFKCFAGCSVIDILRSIRRLQLQVPVHQPVSKAETIPGPRSTNAARAAQLWNLALAIRGTPGDDYFRARGLDVAGLPLRFHPRTPLGSGRDVCFRPAVIAPICDERGLTAIQRIFLDPRSASLAADLDHPRRALGRPLGGAVRLAPSGSMLGLAEGVETAVAAMFLLGIPVWATLGNERLPRINIPDAVEHLVLLPDADKAGIASARLATKAYAQPGRTIETRLPFGAVNDWNDALRARRIREGERGGTPVRQVA